MEIGQVIKINRMIHEGDYDDAKKMCQESINEFLEYNHFHGFDKFNLDLNMAGSADIGDDMLKQYKKEYEEDGYKPELIFHFNLSNYANTTTDESWNGICKDQIFRHLVNEIKPDEVTCFPFDLSIIDNYYSVEGGAYQFIIEDKERCAIKVEFEKIRS